MQTYQRPFRGAADIQEMIALAQAFPDDSLHVIDLPYRFSSWALDSPENVGLWIDALGALVAWAVLQPPFWTIDYAFHRDARPSIHRRILGWADERARQVLNTASGRPCWFVTVFENQMDRRRELEAAGFTCQSDVGEDSWSKVLMARAAGEPIPRPALPKGFVVHPLAGDGEVEAYVELHQSVFESRNMTAAWRARTLRCPQYTPELDLVAATLDGRLAAFCVCWFHQCPQGASAQIEPLGVRADLRHLGLGRVILSEALRRAHTLGARQVYVETDKYRDGALGLYHSAGFRIVRDVLVYRKDYEGSANRVASSGGVVKIRKAKIEDSAGLAKVQVDSYRTAYTGIFPQAYLDQFSYEEQEQDWRDWIVSRSEDLLYVAEDATGEIVGYALARPGPREIAPYDSELIALHVIRSHQRQGIGRWLVAAVAGQLWQEGCGSLMLWVLEENRARGFYERLGGKLLGESQVNGCDTIEVAYGWPSIRVLCG